MSATRADVHGSSGLPGPGLESDVPFVAATMLMLSIHPSAKKPAAPEDACLAPLGARVDRENKVFMDAIR